MGDWREVFKLDPIVPLLDEGDVASDYFVRRDLLGEVTEPLETLWKLPEVRRILKKQGLDGGWSRPGVDPNAVTKHTLIETWKQFRVLVDKYEMDRNHPQIEKAAEIKLYCQTADGDIRDMIGNQYATYFTYAYCHF